MNKIILVNLFFSIAFFNSCIQNQLSEDDNIIGFLENGITKTNFSINDICIEKDLLYDKYTLADIYPYKDTTRCFQWQKIRELLFFVDSIQKETSSWAVIQNYKNRKGEASLVKNYSTNVYGNIIDEDGVERYQSVPLFHLNDSLQPERYGRDGSLIKYKEQQGNFVFAEDIWNNREWLIPLKYIKAIKDSIVFKKVIVVDVTNQNIATMEKVDSIWYVRSKNPATTGARRPPYQYETPVGLFVFQERKQKMYFLQDGTTELGGYSPFANRFCNGAYIHGVPVNVPRTTDIEYSYTLGTVPRSHMCVRNATSHAEFVYNWIDVMGSLLFVIK